MSEARHYYVHAQRKSTTLAEDRDPTLGGLHIACHLASFPQAQDIVNQHRGSTKSVWLMQLLEGKFWACVEIVDQQADALLRGETQREAKADYRRDGTAGAEKERKSLMMSTSNGLHVDTYVAWSLLYNVNHC